MTARRVGDTPVSDEEARTVACPECGVAPGDLCVYTWPAGVTPGGRHNAAVRSLIDRVGTPTMKVHNGRRAAAHAQRPPVENPPTTVRVRMAGETLTLDADEIRAMLADTTLSQWRRNALETGLWRLIGSYE